jgi:hypothetical protein
MHQPYLNQYKNGLQVQAITKKATGSTIGLNAGKLLASLE